MRSLICVVFLSWLGGSWALAQESADPVLCLTNIAQVRALSEEEALRGYEVRLTGVVTFEISLRYFFIHDLTNGLCLERTNTGFHLKAGQLVEVTGRTHRPEGNAPLVVVSDVRVIGRAPLPPVRQVSCDEIASNQEDCQWLEVRGIVRTATQTTENRFDVDLAVAGKRLRICLPAPPPIGESRLVDSTVVARGVRGCIFNQKRQVLAPLLFVDANNFTIEELAAEDPFAGEARPLRSLLQFGPNPRQGHRIKVQGVVTHQNPGRFFFITDGRQGLRLETAQTEILEPGDLIEAVGFVAAGKVSPLLQEVTFRRVGHGPPPTPVRISAASAMEGVHDADLVTIDATLVGSVRRRTEEVLILQDDGVGFDAELGQAVTGSAQPRPLEGSRLRLTGICQVQDIIEERATVRPESFRILLGSAADLRVVQYPPWWNSRRLAWLLSALTVLFLGVLGAVIIRSKLKLRAQARGRAEAEGRFSAIIAERNRMAREIHDTLAQGYTAISAQLEILKDKISESPQAVRHLELARGFVRSSLTEARRSIWEMRSQALEQLELPQALANLAEQLTAGTSVRAQVHTEGAVRRLPVIVENNLLRIGQEAVTNGLKYAAPREISIALEYGSSDARLRVCDDGCGFDITKVAPSENGGFGLMGIRERVQQMGGNFVVRSQPGKGTEVLVEVPVV